MISDILSSLNSWIVNHKELVTLAGIPLITYFVNLIVSSSVKKRTIQATHAAEVRAEKERKLQLELSRRLKLADFRQEWINSLREDFSAILSHAVEIDVVDEDLSRDINKRIRNILLRMNPREVGAKAIYEKIIQFINEEVEEKRLVIAHDLTNMMNLFLKNEWERLKAELEDYDKLSVTQ